MLGRKQVAEVVIYEGDDCSLSNPGTRVVGIYMDGGKPWVSNEDIEIMAQNEIAEMVGRLLVSAPVARYLFRGNRGRISEHAETTELADGVYLDKTGGQSTLTVIPGELSSDDYYDDRYEIPLEGTVAFGKLIDAGYSYKEARERAFGKPPSSRVGREGFVYLLESGGVFKIGHSKVVDKRVAQISPIMPYPVEIVLSVESDDRFSLERQLHEKFADKRLNGEWFALTEADVDFIRGLAGDLNG